MQPNPVKRWLTVTPIPPETDRELVRYSPLMRQILYNRGYSTAEAARDFLEARPPQAIDPYNLLGMRAAVDRIWYAIDHGERIAVYGDYDADGVTATALLTHVLLRLKANAYWYIPNRFDEGYGLNIEALDSLAADGIDLVITVDCGVRSIEEADYALKIGMDLIITDHHLPIEQLPKAAAVIDQKQPGDQYPDKNLAGVGLAFKLATALLEKAGANTANLIYPSAAVDYLDLVALGTVSDQAPLIGENRAMVRLGLEYLRKPHRQGILSLIGAAQINPASINAETIAFGLGPRLNAAGRLDSAVDALNLLLTSDVNEAARLAQSLDNQNRDRQEKTREIQAHAEQSVQLNKDDLPLIFIAHESYNPGLIGLAAHRLMEKYYRPAIVASQGDEYTRGSCRSIPEFHITEALDQCADLLIRHGGHAAAAGFTVSNSNLPALIERLQVLAREKFIEQDLGPKIHADAEVELSELHPGLLKELAWLEPTGSSNPSPAFICRHVRVLRSHTVGHDRSHLKLSVTDGQITFDAIAFRFGHLQPELPLYLDLFFSFELNRFNGKEYLQLNVKDIHPADVNRTF